MRVITGSAKGRTLLPVPGEATRPITDRVKEGLFSILESQDAVAGQTFLDLFGGTGAVGIEALSRGATHAVFCEKDRRALETLARNLERTGLADRATIFRGDAFRFLERSAAAAFDVIYVAPPQYRDLWQKALQAIDRQPELLAAGGQVIVQIHPKESRDLPLTTLGLVDERRYGSTLLLFYVPIQHADS